jgi:hypothetical protein
MIEITLGIDLTEEKVKAIRNHNISICCWWGVSSK